MFRATLIRILRLGAPLLAGNLASYLMKAVDLAMLGHLGTETLAAAGIATLATGILYTFIWPVSVGVQALASRRYGKQIAAGDGAEDAAGTGKVLANGVAAGWLTAAIALSLSTCIEPILRLILANPVLVDLSLEYIKTLRWSLILISVGMAHRGFFAAVNQTAIVMVATLLGNVLNAFLDWALIFGNLGLPALGIRGAALGTLLSEATLTLLFVGYGQLSGAMKRYYVMRFKHIQRGVVQNIIRVMFPPAVQNAAALSIFLTYQTMVERVGTDYLAVTSLLFTLFRINKTLVGGFAQGASILVGNRLGAGDREAARVVFVAQELVAFIIGGAVVTLLLLLPGSVLGLFSLAPSLIPLGRAALRFFAAFFFIEVMAYSFEIVFSHNGWGTLVLISEFVTNVVFILGLTYVAGWILHLGIYGVWAGFAVYQVAHASILTAGYFSRRWQRVEVERERGVRTAALS